MTDLIGWTEEFVKHKDILSKSIHVIKKTDDGLIVVRKNTEQIFVIKNNILEAIELADDNVYIVTLNTRTNLNILVQNWHRLAKMPGMTMYFVNPDSTTEIKWVIRPNLHDKVADDDSLKHGLESMFSMVDEV